MFESLENELLEDFLRFLFVQFFWWKNKKLKSFKKYFISSFWITSVLPFSEPTGNASLGSGSFIFTTILSWKTQNQIKKTLMLNFSYSY